MLEQMDLTFSEHSIPKHRKYILFNCKWIILREDCMSGHTTSLSKFKKTEINQASFLTTMIWRLNQLEAENWKIHKYVNYVAEIKQYAPEQPMGQRRKEKSKTYFKTHENGNTA